MSGKAVRKVATMILPCSSAELNIEVCLLNGQTFRFVKFDSAENYPVIRGVACDRVWQFQRVDEQQISYQVLARFAEAVADEDEAVLKAYFQLDVDLLKLYTQWSEKDSHFKTQLENNIKHLTGIRVLRQSPVETLFSFLCSSNNNVKRISAMVNSLAELYGDRVDVKLDGQKQTFYNFPTLEQLYENSEDMEDELKERKFGYRAAWVVKAVEKLTDLGGCPWLEALKSRTYKEASQALINNFLGIGKKVADCICLMGLGFNNVVPIDTHVFKITSNYLPNLPKEYGKLNAQHHLAIQKDWIERFGDYAGWSQATLFTNQLAQYKVVAKKRKR